MSLRTLVANMTANGDSQILTNGKDFWLKEYIAYVEGTFEAGNELQIQGRSSPTGTWERFATFHSTGTIKIDQKPLQIKAVLTGATAGTNITVTFR